MVFGFMLCLDCFLFIFTYLPLRVAVALFNLLCGIFCFPRLVIESKIAEEVVVKKYLKQSSLKLFWRRNLIPKQYFQMVV